MTRDASTQTIGTSPRDIYRDATFSRQTRNRMQLLLSSVAAGGEPEPEWIDALADVIHRWDTNEATEVRA